MSEITKTFAPQNNIHIQMTSTEKSKDSKAIINELAKNKVIEKIVANISPEDNPPDNQDLSQLI